MPLTLVTPPVGWPISLDEAKHQVQQAEPVDDHLLGLIYVPAATERAEGATQRALLRQTWDLLLAGFPSDPYIELPKPPLISVTSVQYVDLAGATHTLTVNTDYLVQAPSGPRCRRGRIALPFSSAWPVAKPQMGAVIIRLVCGYGASALDVPAALRQAMLLDVGQMYANREDSVTGTIVTPIERTSAEVYLSHRSRGTQAAA